MKKPLNQVRILLILPGFLLLGLAGCSEIFEEDISNQLVSLLSPSDSLASTKVSQTFRWQALPGARTYRLEVASPAFAAPVHYLDTTTQELSLRLLLEAGKYEWRLRAANAGYQTNAVGRFLRIDSSSNLQEQDLYLFRPYNNTILAVNQVDFQWDALPMAERYVLQIAELSSSDTTSSNKFKKILPSQSQSYTWRVIALNTGSQRISNQTFAFTVDLSTAQAAALIAPADNSYFQSLPLTLSWQRGSESVSRDSVYLYSVNQTLVSGFPKAVTTTTYQLTYSAFSLGRGTYYWAVKSVLTNGRVSPLSEKRRFSIL